MSELEYKVEGRENIKASFPTEKEQRIKEFRREASRLAAIANKRIERLEKNNLTSTPAYKRYVEGGRFGVKGKDYNQVQKELSRLKAFLASETSTIRGANKTLKEMAKNTGIQYSNLKELRDKAPKFFELASKVEQYLRNVEDMASAIGYQKIWEAINQYTDSAKVDLAQADTDIDGMITAVTRALTEFEKPIADRINVSNTPFNWYPIKK